MWFNYREYVAEMSEAKKKNLDEKDRLHGFPRKFYQ